MSPGNYKQDSGFVIGSVGCTDNINSW